MGAHQRLPPSGRPGCIMLDHTTMGGADNSWAAARTEAAGAVGRASNLARPYVYNRIAASRIVLLSLRLRGTSPQGGRMRRADARTRPRPLALRCQVAGHLPP